MKKRTRWKKNEIADVVSDKMRKDGFLK